MTRLLSFLFLICFLATSAGADEKTSPKAGPAGSPSELPGQKGAGTKKGPVGPAGPIGAPSALPDEKGGPAGAPASLNQKDGKGWKPLFNGKDLDGWKATNFGGEGEVSFKDGKVTIVQGVDLSGINSTRKDWPKMNYEFEFEAQRFEGSDFFVGVTFPVEDSHISLICGGWGGGVCGVSSLDGLDASENETTSYLSFDNGRWYKVRVKVTEGRLRAWLDGKDLVDVETEGRKIDVRFEVDLSKPFGFATYQSTAVIRNARIRTLPPKKAGAGPVKAPK